MQKTVSKRANNPFFQLTRPFPARLPPSPDATLVTYGGLAKKPVLLGAGSFIFRGLTATGFWLSSPGRAADRVPGLEEAADLLARGVLKTECAREEGGGRRGGGGGTARGQRRPPPNTLPSIQRVPLADWRTALDRLRAGGAGAVKQVLVPP